MSVDRRWVALSGISCYPGNKVATKSFAVFAVGLASVGSLETQPMPAPAIAFRYDRAHVVVVLEDLTGYRREHLAGLYDFEASRGPMQPDRVTGVPVVPAGLIEADLGVWARKFGSPPLGTTWALHLSSSRSVTCTVDEVGVSALSGCQDGLVALCEVSSDELEAFRAEGANHFVLTEPRAASSEPPHSEFDPTVTEGERNAIARELEKLLPDELARVRKDAEGEYERQKQWAWVPRWQGFDERLANGEGVIELDINKVALGSERSRFFVRAQWRLGDDVAFIARAWVRLGDGVVVEELDALASRWLRMPEFQTFGLDKTWLGEVLNVVDVNGDDTPEVIFLDLGYEAMLVRAFEYGPDGPGEALATYGAGC